jgi:hypothetical protein
MIIISGDSWGVGEWGFDPVIGTLITGPGIAQYFGMHNKVVNLSEGGCGNTDSFLYLRRFLTKYKTSNCDIFYFIVTDPMRDGECLDDLSQGIEQAARLQLNKILKKLNQLANDHKIQINLIGGCCDLDTVDIVSYNHLKIVVPSWGQLLDETYPSSIFWGDGLRKIDTNRLNCVELKEEWTKLADLTLQKEATFNKWCQTGLSSDGGHPNRYGHRILRDFLCPGYEHKI